jgi:uncharacterized oxidoreductase
MSANRAKEAVLVTGGGSGIGLAVAVEFLDRGYDVAICGRDPARLASATKQHPRLLAFEADVAKPADQDRIVAWLRQNMPQINVLVNNAGVQHAHDFSTRVSAGAIHREIEINLFGPVALTAVVLPLLLDNEDPAVINVTSGLAFCPLAHMPVYCATKAALHSFTMTLRHQLRSRVRVVEFVPPMVATDLGKAHRPPDDGGVPAGISAAAFAREAVDRFDSLENEIVVGPANALRLRGEALFTSINR